MKTNQEIVKEDISIFSDASPKRSDSIYNQINAPHYRDFLNDITFGEGDSWFDKQNTTTIFSFLEKKVDDFTVVANDSIISKNVKIQVKQETNSKELKIPKNFEPPKRVKNYPSFRSPGIQKRQPVKKFVPELTVPRPFKFHAINRINKTENQLSASPYIPLAARVKQFIEKTPDRFKSKLVSIKPATVQVKPPTKPKSPLLRTKLRAKPRKVFNENERKKQETNKIRAKSVNSKSFELVPVSFVFQTDTRMKERKAFDQQRKLRDQMKNSLREKKREDARHT
ncbi:15304_t:CDS:2, partial [Cetraspora pellucida]